MKEKHKAQVVSGAPLPVLELGLQSKKPSSRAHPLNHSVPDEGPRAASEGLTVLSRSWRLNQGRSWQRHWQLFLSVQLYTVFLKNLFHAPLMGSELLPLYDSSLGCEPSNI